MNELLLADSCLTLDTVYHAPEALAAVQTHYCPGCTHGVAHRILAEAIDELNLRERAILVAPVAVPCSPTSILMWTAAKRHTDGRRLWQRASSGCSQIIS